MPTSRNDVRVICPFYKYDEKPNGIFRIVCEGLVDDSSIVLAYKRKNDFYIQLGTFCCQNFDRCEIYRAINEKYED